VTPPVERSVARNKVGDGSVGEESGKASTLAWLRQPAGAPSPHNLLGLIEQLNVIREIKLPAQMGQAVHQNRLLQLAREGAQSDAPLRANVSGRIRVSRGAGREEPQ
jgi:hypothetical protein